MIEAFSSLLKWPLTFDEEKHVYALNGEKIPSVTQVLRELNGFPEQDEGFVSEAAEEKQQRLSLVEGKDGI